jgi:hypothetical protein
VAAWLGFILKVVAKVRLGSIAYIIRLFRLGRVLRLIKKAKTLKKVLETLIFALPALFNLGSLLTLFLFMFSIFGVSLYAELMLDDDNLDGKANFKSFD